MKTFILYIVIMVIVSCGTGEPMDNPKVLPIRWTKNGQS